jgi:ribosome biogenesis GTPase
MKEGIITRGIAGFYYVRLDDKTIVECKARGKFRKENISPVVGDRVLITLIDDSHGVIDEIKERKNLLRRPQVANIDQAIVVFSHKKPDINFSLLDRLLIMIEHYNIEAVICLNKSDFDDGIFKRIAGIYGKIGYKVFQTNGLTGEGLEDVKSIIKGKISVFSGPSGVGKSTISNYMQNQVLMQTGDISRKVDRGKHTTRHAELIEVEEETFIVDTPGFSSIDLSFMQVTDLQHAFKEFSEFIDDCRFKSCLHYKEQDCAVKEAVEKNMISPERYDAYIEILQEMQKNWRKK